MGNSRGRHLPRKRRPVMALDYAVHGRQSLTRTAPATSGAARERGLATSACAASARHIPTISVKGRQP